MTLPLTGAGSGAAAAAGGESNFIMRPDGDDSKGFPFPGGTHFDKVNEVVIQPSPGNTNEIWSTGAQDDVSDVFTLTAASGNASVLRVWVYAADDGDEPTVTVDIYVDGGWLGAKSIPTLAEAPTFNWLKPAADWSGTWSQASLNSAKLKIRKQGAGVSIFVRTLYVEANPV